MGLKLPCWPHLYYYWRVAPSTYVFVRAYFYFWSFVKIFSFYGNLFESLFIYNHLWKFFPFMRIFLNLFSFMIICENFFFLWKLFQISSCLWFSVRIFFFFKTLWKYASISISLSKTNLLSSKHDNDILLISCVPILFFSFYV